MPSSRSHPALLLVLAFLVSPAVSLAVDGVVLIDQTLALVGGITPGDLPGFPISITQPGSYRLSGNLTVAATNASAIEISASNVTLDLNGFHILGPASNCTIPQACTQYSGVITVPSAAQYTAVKVSHGSISGFVTRLALSKVTYGVAEDLTLARVLPGSTTIGDAVGAKFVVHRVITETSFAVGCPGTVVVQSVAASFTRVNSTSGCVFSNVTGTIN